MSYQPSPNRRVAWRLKNARLTRGWTQAQLAERLGGRWTRATVGFAERSMSIDHPERAFDVEDLERFCEVFGMPLGYWFTDEVSGAADAAPEQRGRLNGLDRLEELNRERIAESRAAMEAELEARLAEPVR